MASSDDPLDEPVEGVEEEPETPRPRPADKALQMILAPGSEGLKLPAFMQKMGFEQLPQEAALALRQEYFNLLWTADFLGWSDMKLEAIGDYMLIQICSQDKVNWPRNYETILEEIKTLTPELRNKLGLLKVGYAWNYTARTKLGLEAMKEPFKPYTTDDLKLLFTNKDNGTPDQYGTNQVAGIIAESARKRRDCFMVIDVGSTGPFQYGAGKSQLMLQLIHQAYLLLGGIFNPAMDVVYSDDRVRFNRLLDDVEPLKPFGVDEFDPFCYKRNWSKTDNKEIVIKLTRTRKWGRPLIGCTGSIWQLDQFLRDIKITHRIRIVDWDDEHLVGRAQIHRKGGFQKEEEDKWGMWLFSFDYYGIPSVAYKQYVKLVLAAEKSSGETGLDRFLQNNPGFLADDEGT